MKNAFFILLALFVATPAAATDDDKPTNAPVAVEVLGVEEIPFTLAVPASLDSVLDSVAAEADTPPGCYRQMKEYQLEVMQYGLIVSIAADVPMEYGVALGGIGILSRYADCKIRKRRANRGAEQH